MNPSTPPSDWERQRAFLAVLEEGSLSGAARRLRLAQPTVRRRIEELEAELGAALFTRSPAGLTPTVMAEGLADHARAMEIAAEAFARAASADSDAATGMVRVTASEVIGIEVLPPLIAELQADHPGLVIALGLNNRSEDLMRREADIAVRMVRPTQAALLAKRVGAIGLGLHAHRRVLAAHGEPSDLRDLRRFPAIGFEHETISVQQLRGLGFAMRREDFAFRTDSDLGQLAAIRAGCGVGVCQNGLGARDPNLVRLLPEAFAFDMETWIVTHEDLRNVRRIRLVFDKLVEGLTAYAASA